MKEKRNEDKLGNLCVYSKSSNIHIVDVPEEERKGQRTYLKIQYLKTNLIWESRQTYKYKEHRESQIESTQRVTTKRDTVIKMGKNFKIKRVHTWLLEKATAFPRGNFVGKVMSLLFNMLSRSVIAFLPRRSYTYIFICVCIY